MQSKKFVKFGKPNIEKAVEKNAKKKHIWDVMKIDNKSIELVNFAGVCYY